MINKGKLKTVIIAALVFICLILLGVIVASQYKFHRYEIGSKEDFAGSAEVRRYLEDKVISKSFGGKAFCRYEVLGTEDKNTIINQYISYYCQEYHRENGTLAQGTGMAGPGLLVLERNGETIKIIGHSIPGFYEDTQTAIPAQYLREYEKHQISSGNPADLEMQHEAELYFKTK